MKNELVNCFLECVIALSIVALQPCTLTALLLQSRHSIKVGHACLLFDLAPSLFFMLSTALPDRALPDA